MKDIILRLNEIFEVIKEERSLRFRAEVMLIFMIIGVIFMTGIYIDYERQLKKVSTVMENIEISGTAHYNLMQIGYNVTPMQRGRGDIKYIVVHDTGNNKASADAMNHFKYFNSGNQKASADFFVDSDMIIQTNDYYKYYTWHCGDGGRDAKINNRNSIGVEICINSDGNYAVSTEKAADLIRILMKELNIDINHVVRHYDASGKDCPVTMNNADWKYLKEKIEKKKTDPDYVLSYLRAYP